MGNAFKQYIADVKSLDFPSEREQYWNLSTSCVLMNSVYKRVKGKAKIVSLELTLIKKQKCFDQENKRSCLFEQVVLIFL